MRPGDLIAGRYMIECVAGAGGMGTVYRAVDQREGELVALKLLRGGAPDVAARFAHEARILAELSHPYIVRYLGQGTTDKDEPYFVMEWLEGENLAQRIARGPLTPDQTVTLGRHMAEALAAAHVRGVVHRDVKPSNVFILGSGLDNVRLLDFGIARLTDASTLLTLTGSAMGTPAYMAPEQASGQRDLLDARADVFSLGAVLFECLAGRPPFVARHVMALLAKLMMEEAPRLSTLLPSVPSALERLIARMLAKNPALRPAHGAAVAAALDALDHPEASRSQPPHSITRAEKRLVAVVAIVPELEGPRPMETSEPGQTQVSSQEQPAADGTKPSGPARSAAASHVFTEARLAAHSFGANIIELANGALVALLDRAGPATDQAAAAARCALQMRAKLPAVPMVLLMGRSEGLNRSPVGEVLDRAAEMLARTTDVVAHAGGMVAIEINDIAHSLLGPRFEVIEREGRIYLTGESATTDETRLLLGRRSPFVGRERDLRNLIELIQESFEERRASAILVTAPAGMGKSRLRVALLDTLRSRMPALVSLVGYGDSFVPGTPFAILGGALQHAASVTAGDPLALRRSKLTAFVERYLEGDEQKRVSALVGDLIGGKAPDETSSDPFAALQGPAQLGEPLEGACATLLGAVADTAPTLLILDDLHWGDTGSVDVIDGLLRDLADRPLVVLAFARPEVYQLFPNLWASRATQEIRLRELPRRAAESLVRTMLGETVSETAVATIVDRAAGNAFYLEELIRAVADGRDERLPETVLGMVEERLAGLDPDARRILRAASVFGDVFWKGGVLTLVGEDAPGAGDRLARLCDEELIVRRSKPRFAEEEEYAFRHALLREGAYATLTDRDRAFGHWLAGTWLESMDERNLAVLAEHFLRGGEPQRGVELYVRAGNTARAADAGCEALRTLGIAIPSNESERRTALALIMAADTVMQPPAARFVAPEMTDPAAISAERLLMTVAIPAYFHSEPLFGIVVYAWLDLLSRHGHSEISPMGYVNFGAFLTGIAGRSRDGYAFGQLAMNLLERRPNPAVYCRVVETFAGNIAFLHEPLRDVLSRFPAAVRVGIEENDLVHVAYIAGHTGIMRLAVGDDLAEVGAQIEELIPFVDRSRDVFMQAMVRITRRTTRTLRGLMEDASGTKDPWSEEALLALGGREDLRTLAGNHRTQRLLCSIVQGSWSTALTEAKEAEAGGPYAPGQFFVTELVLLAALARLAANESPDEGPLAAHREALNKLAADCPATYRARHLLVEAEVARVQGDDPSADAGYTAAIAAAHEDGMRRDLALAAECAAIFHASRGHAILAATYRATARTAYARWGATAKVHAMDSEHARTP